MANSCIPVLTEGYRGADISASWSLPFHRLQGEAWWVLPVCPSRIPRFKVALDTLEAESWPSATSPSSLRATPLVIEYGLPTPPVSPPEAKDSESVFKPGLFANPNILPVTPPQTPPLSPTPSLATIGTGSSPFDPEWLTSPRINSIIFRRVPAIVRLEHKTPVDNITQSQPPSDSIDRSGPCVQCDLLRLKCDQKQPTCSRCARRQATAREKAFESGRQVTECIGEKDSTGPCLEMRTMTSEEMKSTRFRGSVFGRVRGDNEETWDKKVALRRELFERVGERRDRGNWALPLPIVKHLVTAEVMWKRVVDGEPGSGRKGDW